VKRENGGACSEPIKTRSNYMKLTQSAGKRVRTSHDWFGFTSDWMKKWREFLANRVGL